MPFFIVALCLLLAQIRFYILRMCLHFLSNWIKNVNFISNKLFPLFIL